MKIEEIKNVIVDKISFVSKGKRPAVEKAENRFAIFKMFDSKKGLNEEQTSRLDKIIKKYKDIEK